MYNMYFFFVSAGQISPSIKIYNMNFDAGIAESQLIIKIEGLNKYMFAKLNTIYSFLFFVFVLFLFLYGGAIELSPSSFAMYFLNVMLNYNKQPSQNI